MTILEEIQARMDKENRTPNELYAELRQLGLQMMVLNTIGKEQVVMFCSSLVKLYELLKPNNI